MTASPNQARPTPRDPGSSKLARQIGLFDATMLVMGGIIGAGIFMNPYVVAQRVHTPFLILGVWLAGGIIALLGAFIYAELGDRMPAVGGQYAYLREAFHPAVGFAYGWVLLLVIQTGGMAAVTVTFARYFRELTGTGLSEQALGLLTLALLTFINCLGVKLGSRVQSVLMVCKIAGIAALVITGLFLLRHPQPLNTRWVERGTPVELLGSVGAALVPVLFAYGGYQTANFVAGELKDPRRDLSRALVMGVAGVIALYVGVNLADLRALGANGLAETAVPATATMRTALGQPGATFIAFAIALSTVGFLSQSVLTAPRVYFAMAADGLFFRSMAAVSSRTRVPVVAIVAQSVWTAVIMLAGRYEQVLNYVISMDLLFMGLTATTVFVFRARERGLPESATQPGSGYRIPGHPFTTLIFIVAAWAVVATTIYKYPSNSLIGMAILALGFPAYLVWARARRTGVPAE